MPKRPNGDLNQLVRTLDAGARFTINDVRSSEKSQAVPVRSCLASEDEEYLVKLIALLRSGKSAVIIVDDAECEKLKYMFSNASRAYSVEMMAKVIEKSATRLKDAE